MSCVPSSTRPTSRRRNNVRRLGSRSRESRWRLCFLGTFRRANRKANHCHRLCDQSCRVCNGRASDQFVERRNYIRIDQHGARVINPAVYDTMSNSYKMVAGELGAQKCDQVVEGAIVAELRTFCPGLL